MMMNDGLTKLFFIWLIILGEIDSLTVSALSKMFFFPERKLQDGQVGTG
jgi:hypothetical protein